MILSINGYDLNGMYVHNVLDKKDSDFFNRIIVEVLFFKIKKHFQREVKGRMFTCTFEPENLTVVRVFAMLVEFDKKIEGDHIKAYFKKRYVKGENVQLTVHSTVIESSK